MNFAGIIGMPVANVEKKVNSTRCYIKEIPMPLTTEEIENRVGFHKATIEGANATLPKHAYLRQLMKDVMTELNDALPDGRAKSVAMTHLEDVSMWSHKAISELAPVVPEGVNVDTPAVEPTSAEEMRSWILNHFGHVRGLCKLSDNSDQTFIRWLYDYKHITTSQYQCAYPEQTQDPLLAPPPGFPTEGPPRRFA